MARWIVEAKKPGGLWKPQTKTLSSKDAIDTANRWQKQNPTHDFRIQMVGVIEKVRRNPAPKMADGAKMKSRSIDLPRGTATTIAEMRKKLGAKKNPLTLPKSFHDNFIARRKRATRRLMSKHVWVIGGYKNAAAKGMPNWFWTGHLFSPNKKNAKQYSHQPTAYDDMKKLRNKIPTQIHFLSTYTLKSARKP